MYFDRAAFQQEVDRATKYEELKKFISTPDETGKMNEYFLAGYHLVKMENEIKDQQKQLDKYYQFFKMLSELLPRQSSIYDPIR